MAKNLRDLLGDEAGKAPLPATTPASGSAPPPVVMPPEASGSETPTGGSVVERIVQTPGPLSGLVTIEIDAIISGAAMRLTFDGTINPASINDGIRE